MAEEVIQAKRIELLDAQGHASIILEGADAETHRAGLMVSSIEDDSPLATIGVDLASGNPFFLLGNREEEGASAFITFNDGRVFMQLRNADGSELTLTP